MEDLYIVYYPENHEHLHLMDDLKNKEGISLYCTNKIKTNNSFVKAIQKVHLSHSLFKILKLPFRDKWYHYTKIQTLDEANYKILVMDGALKALNKKYLNDLSSRKNISLSLVLINAINAESVSMIEIKNDIDKVKWNSIWTFDPMDASSYGYYYLGTTYYSKLSMPNNYTIDYDAYFQGGLKGNRKNNLLDLFEYLEKQGCECKFSIMLSGKDRLTKRRFDNKIEYYESKWLPYEDNLISVMKSNCIIEILQEGQTGQSLRYFEAVCFNKKLITNNDYIKALPFYNENYMKVIKDYSDIDIKWLKERENINYGYTNEFSPCHMLQKIFKER